MLSHLSSYMYPFLIGFLLHISPASGPLLRSFTSLLSASRRPQDSSRKRAPPQVIYFSAVCLPETSGLLPQAGPSSGHCSRRSPYIQNNLSRFSPGSAVPSSKILRISSLTAFAVWELIKPSPFASNRAGFINPRTAHRL